MVVKIRDSDSFKRIARGTGCLRLAIFKRHPFLHLALVWLIEIEADTFIMVNLFESEGTLFYGLVNFNNPERFLFFFF